MTTLPTASELMDWIDELKNWGRWGPDDQARHAESDQARTSSRGRAVGHRRPNGVVCPGSDHRIRPPR